jgi:3-methylfumaryl-CoA hydratase
VSEDFEQYRAWVGRTQSSDDTIGAWPVRALSATLDRRDPPAGDGDEVPPCWHWLYFLETCPGSELAADGHARRGGFLPPVPLPRRMWAGGRIEWRAPLVIGERATRVSEIVSVAPKHGRSGRLVFVTVRHTISARERVAIIEEHDIVYRDAPAPGMDAAAAAPSAAPAAGAAWQRTVMPDEVLLFRYSALTFNGHRIHYDQPYATGVEGYPGLIVHGPLQATLLVDLVRRESARPIARFEYRALAPIWAGQPLTVHGQPEPDGHRVALWATDAAGQRTMGGTVVLG